MNLKFWWEIMFSETPCLLRSVGFWLMLTNPERDVFIPSLIHTHTHLSQKLSDIQVRTYIAKILTLKIALIYNPVPCMPKVLPSYLQQLQKWKEWTAFTRAQLNPMPSAIWYWGFGNKHYCECTCPYQWRQPEDLVPTIISMAYVEQCTWPRSEEGTEGGMQMRL